MTASVAELTFIITLLNQNNGKTSYRPDLGEADYLQYFEKTVSKYIHCSVATCKTHLTNYIVTLKLLRENVPGQKFMANNYIQAVLTTQTNI